MSMKQLAGLISVLGAAGAGYARGNQVYLDNQRRAKLDARDEEEYQYTRAQRERAQATDDAVNAAMADQSVEEVQAPNMASADISMAGPQPTRYRLGDKEYDDAPTARRAAEGINSKASKYQRAAEAVATTGGAAGLERAAQYEAFAKRALDEGADQILTGVQKSAPTLDALKAAGGTLQGGIDPSLAEVFNKTGSHWRVSGDAKVEHFIAKDAAGREFVNSRILGADGKPVVGDVANAGLFLTDMKTRLEAKRADTQTYQTGLQIANQGKQIEETTRHNQAVEKETATNNAEARKIQWGTLNLARAKDKREAELFKNQTIDGQLEQIEKAVGPMSEDDKKAYRKKLLGIGGSKDTDGALIADLTKKWSENNPAATAGDVAKFRSELQDSFTTVANNRAVMDDVRAQFTKNPFGSAGYATVYNDAKAQLGLTDQQLGAWGYQPPGGDAKPSRAAARGTGAPAPNYRQQQAAEAATAKASRIAELSKNVAGLQAMNEQGQLTEFARRSLAEQAAELAQLQGQPAPGAAAPARQAAPARPVAPDPRRERQMADLRTRIDQLEEAKQLNGGRLNNEAYLVKLKTDLQRLERQ